MATEPAPKSGDPIGEREKFLMACGMSIKKGVYNNASAAGGGGAGGGASASDFKDALGVLTGGLIGSVIGNPLQNVGSIGSIMQNLISGNQWATILANGKIPSGIIGNLLPIIVHKTFEKDIQNQIQQMVSYADISSDGARSFLYAIMAISDPKQMEKLADASQIAELADKEFMNNAEKILGLKDLYKAAYLAESMFAFLNMSGQFSGAANSAKVLGTTNPLSIASSIINSLGSGSGSSGVGGGTGGGGSGGGNDKAGSPGAILGNILTKLIKGKEIPMNIQANNPMLQAPSIIGKMMFGEAPVGTSAIDMNQLFAKPIGVFADMGGGAASQMFNFKNVGSAGGGSGGSSQSGGSLDDIVKKVVTGGITPKAESFGEDMLKQVQKNVQDKLGSAGGALADMTKPDTMIPVSGALSDALTGLTEKLPAINKTFRKELETITQKKDQIQKVMQEGMNEESAKKLGLDKLSEVASSLPEVAGVGNFPSIFPTDMFASSFADMMSATSHLKSLNKNYDKVLGLL